MSSTCLVCAAPILSCSCDSRSLNETPPKPSAPRKAEMCDPDAWEVFHALDKALRRCPELRIGQLIVNAVGDDPYHVSNVDLAEALRKYEGGRKTRR